MQETFILIVSVCVLQVMMQNILPVIHGVSEKQILRSSNIGESWPSTATVTLQVQTSLSLPLGPPSALLPTRNRQTRPSSEKAMLSVSAQLDPRPQGEEQVWQCRCPELIVCLETCPS